MNPEDYKAKIDELERENANLKSKLRCCYETEDELRNCISYYEKKCCEYYEQAIIAGIVAVISLILDWILLL